MSAINSIGSNVAPYQPITSSATQSKPAKPAASVTAAPTSVGDPDHDGDKDGAGVDIKG